MPCTTILVGKKASYDGSTLMARNEDTGAGSFCPVRFTVVKPEDQPRHYKSVLSHVEMDLPGNPMAYTAVPNADLKEGIWAAAGINTANVAMSATETITSNPRVLGADPLVVLQEAKGKEGEPGYVPEVPGGIGEEDLVTLVLPYIRSARQGVLRLGALLEKYGTYEMNAIGFQDVDEIWWLESIGGHHWMARRVPDDAYVTMPNQLGLDSFDFDDALGEGEEYLCSADLKDFVEDNFLDLNSHKGKILGLDFLNKFNPRDAFGSHGDLDHVYNTPRAYVMQRYFNPHSKDWKASDPAYTPISDDLPWCRVPEKLITIEDIKTVLSNHYQNTPWDPYEKGNEKPFRPIGVNRTSQLHLTQIRPYMPEASRSLQWITFAANTFNALVPFYTMVDAIPDYFSVTDPDRVSTDSFYWMNRLIGTLADSVFHETGSAIEGYQETMHSKGHALIKAFDQKALATGGVDAAAIKAICTEANEAISAMAKEESDKVLLKVLDQAGFKMKTSFSRSDA